MTRGRSSHPSAPDTARTFPTRQPEDPPLVFGNVPPRDPNFTGRDELLDQLTERLSSGATAVLHGLGGIGKTQMATEYIYRHLRDYDLVWWIDAAHTTQIRAGLTELAGLLGLQGASEANIAVPAVIEALRTGRPFRRWLLVFDAAESPETVLPFFPRNGPGEIMITSRNSGWTGVARRLEPAVLNRDDRSVEEPKTRKPAARQIPHTCAFFSPEPISRDLLTGVSRSSNLAWRFRGLFAPRSESPGKHHFGKPSRAGLSGRPREKAAMAAVGGSRHHLIMVADVAGFGEPSRTGPDQRAVREGLYDVMKTAFAATETAWEDCHRGDRGDGILVLVPSGVDKAAFIQAVLPMLVTRLRVHNDTCAKEQQIHLRVALHAGEVGYDPHGFTSSSLTLAFRLCDAPPLKEALAMSPGVLAVIASESLFGEVVRHTPGAAPATWRQVPVKVKEIDTTGWVTLPDHPYVGHP
ncbi:NB-ARC domain-containing protein [Amycolatopsis speibonae]|uniref:NB-ARC domain-containing protein n=1 Tax=Amycolatopsis speibonae TaxID=1450224 RepID=A0ABV7P6T5_9PSEU